jgi:hypothetical protein
VPGVLARHARGDPIAVAGCIHRAQIQRHAAVDAKASRLSWSERSTRWKIRHDFLRSSRLEWSKKKPQTEADQQIETVIADHAAGLTGNTIDTVLAIGV